MNFAHLQNIEMIETSKEFTEFVEKNREKETDKLLLSYSGKCTFDLRLAVNTIEGRRKMVKKVPEWGSNRDLVYPWIISTEQCSSWHTAMFKQQFFRGYPLAIDLTGGLGVDSYYISKVCARVLMFEKNEALYSAAIHNFRALGASNVLFYNMEVSSITIEEVFKGKVSSDVAKKDICTYIDPSRRAKSGKRIYSVKDYEPDIFSLKDIILKYSDRLVVKISPMEDITQILKLFNDCEELHIISVYNECKEILLIIDSHQNSGNWNRTPIIAWNLNRKGEWESTSWTIGEETESNVEYTEPVEGMYLYEPNSSLIKGGAFRIICKRFSLRKADKSSHLYFSNLQNSEFQGKIFSIERVYDFDKRSLSDIRKHYQRSTVSVRNFPLSADELKNKLKIEEGEEFHIFGTTLPLNKKKLIVCKKI